MCGENQINQPIFMLLGLLASHNEQLIYPDEFPLPLKDVILRDATQCTYTRM